MAVIATGGYDGKSIPLEAQTQFHSHQAGNVNSKIYLDNRRADPGLAVFKLRGADIERCIGKSAKSRQLIR